MGTSSWPDCSTVHTVIFDFDGVFTDNKVYVSENGTESVRCDRADGLGMDFMRRYQQKGLLDARIFILSKETNPVVLARARKIGVECKYAVVDKLGFVTRYLAESEKENAISLKGVVFLGNDLNDLPLIRAAGFSVAPVDAHPVVRKAASVVLPQKGGEGFVRAFVERFLGIEKLSGEEVYELVSNS
jgi:N-acylneuraminate cytidylyltransferase